MYDAYEICNSQLIDILCAFAISFGLFGFKPSTLKAYCNISIWATFQKRTPKCSRLLHSSCMCSGWAATRHQPRMDHVEARNEFGSPDTCWTHDDSGQSPCHAAQQQQHKRAQRRSNQQLQQ